MGDITSINITTEVLDVDFARKQITRIYFEPTASLPHCVGTPDLGHRLEKLPLH